MDWMQALRAWLKADVPLTALVSTRIDWGERAQGQLFPALLLTLIADNRDQHLKGFIGTQPAVVQFDCYGDSVADAHAVKEAVIAAAVQAHTGNGHIFQRGMVSRPAQERHERVTANDGSRKTIFRVSMDLTFHHTASEEGS